MALLISWKRQLHLWHRWLGVGVGLLVLLWFGSGVVMMYVPYPALTEQERMAWLEPLAPGALAVSAGDAWASTSLAGVPQAVRLTSVAGRPAWHFLADRRWTSVWADSGDLLRVDAALAAASASAAAVAPRSAVEQIEGDQWTFGRLNAHKPLYRVTANDDAGSVLYVSGRTGELLRDTTRSERAWNWAGSIIHWIYFTPLRSQAEPWRQAVMWTSGVAFVLSVTGMVLGILRLRLRRRYASGKRSPYTGWKAWHHWLGLTAGTLTITWLFSGWLSVTPFGLFSSPGITQQDRLAFAGGPLGQADLSIPLAAALRGRDDLLEIEWRRIGGKLYLSALGRQQRQLLDPATGEAIAVLPPQVLRGAVQAIHPDTVLHADLLTSGDNYYYSHHREAAFPVLRARFALPGDPTYYVDARGGQLVGHVDDASKWNRWLFNALHQLDFAPAVRARPTWDLLVITLCALGALLATTGIVLAWRRLRM